MGIGHPAFERVLIYRQTEPSGKRQGGSGRVLLQRTFRKPDLFILPSRYQGRADVCYHKAM